MINKTKESLSKKPDSGPEQIADAFTALTDEHSRVLASLRQTLDEFMDQEVHGDLQKATNTLSYQHGVAAEVIIDLIVNEQEHRNNQQASTSEED